MERIVLEVDAATAKRWKESSPEIKKGLEQEIDILLEKISHEILVRDFQALLDKARDEAERNGLTEEILEKLLSKD